MSDHDFVANTDYTMTGLQFIGSAIFFYVFLPSLAIMGIWWVIRDLRMDYEYDRDWISFADDYIGPDVDMSPVRNRMLELKRCRA